MLCERSEELDLEVLFREPDSPECRDFVAHARDCVDCTVALERRGEPAEEGAPRTPSVAVAGAAVVIIAVIALLALSDRTDETPGSTRVETPESAAVEAEQPVAAADPPPVREPSQRIGENGRLSVSLDELRKGAPLPLDLEMPDEARGEGPRQVRVVDVERQRRLEATADPISGAGTGLRIEIPPDWLQAGLYMIEVDTAEKKPLPLRRFVLELR